MPERSIPLRRSIPDSLQQLGLRTEQYSVTAQMFHPTSLVLSGGVALGAYQAGVYEALHTDNAIEWIAASSVGAINAALIAGANSNDCMKALRGFWLSGTAFHWPPRGPVRHALNWMNVVQGRVLGSPRHLRSGGLSSFYDLGPTVDFLRQTIDFGRLNSGETRVTVATVDIETGDPVYFDTLREKLEMDHLLASCGFLPEFAPVELGKRLLGDGGFAVNAPIEPVLDELEGSQGLVCVVDLFARDGMRPRTLEAALERKNSLLFANQTYLRLDLYRRFWDRHGIHSPTILYLSYRPLPEEAGAEATFDFSRASAEDRWREGMLDARAADRGLRDRTGDRPTLIPVRRLAS